MNLMERLSSDQRGQSTGITATPMFVHPVFAVLALAGLALTPNAVNATDYGGYDIEADPNFVDRPVFTKHDPIPGTREDWDTISGTNNAGYSVTITFSGPKFLTSSFKIGDGEDYEHYLPYNDCPFEDNNEFTICITKTSSRRSAGDVADCVLADPIPPPRCEIASSALGNRYLSAVCSAVFGSDEVIRVRFTVLDGFPVPGQDFRYVGAPTPAPEEDAANPGETFNAAPLSCVPVFRDWSSDSTIAIYGAEIMPGSEYQVQRANSSCASGNLGDEACWSTPITLTTGKYGDVWPLFDAPGNPPQPDFNDIAAVVQKFLASPGAPTKAMCQLQPNVVFPMRQIDFRDVAADVQAFLGVPYASGYDGPCDCPPSVICGATVCSADLHCVGFGDGLCADGFCTDKCGRCTP